MKLIDKNETLVPPEKYELDTAYAQGAYLVLSYSRTQDNGFTSHVVVFLNDQGREVVRCEYWTPPETPEPEPVKPKSWWARLIEGFQRGE